MIISGRDGTSNQTQIYLTATVTDIANVSSFISRPGSENQKDNHSKPIPGNRQRYPSGDVSAGRASLSNGITPLNTTTSAPPGKSSAFGLGSGAFASFGSAAKTPKTPGTALDYAKSSTITESPTAETEIQTRPTSKHTSASSRTLTRSQSTKDGVGKSQLPLKSAWVVWYRPPTAKHSDYEKSIKAVYKLATVQEFWRVYANLKRPSTLPTVSDYHFFKDGIRPVWEDDANKQGGKWIMRIKKGLLDRFWEEILLAVIGGEFAEAGEEVCGLVISVRSGEDVFSVWTKYDNGRNVKIR